MSEKRSILIFGGTTEGREAAELLAGAGIDCTVSVATRYGEELLRERLPVGGEKLKVLSGRLDEKEMVSLIKEGGFSLVVDATHPYASEARRNIRAASERTGVRRLRISRSLSAPRADAEAAIRSFSSEKEAAEALKETTGNILLTNGVLSLPVFTKAGLSDRIFVRILPSEESIRSCADNGITGRQVIAMQGPFSEELNTVLLKELEIGILVTKVSGREGGFSEKLRAAGKAGIPLFIIEPPKEDDGENTLSMEEFITVISKEMGTIFPPAPLELSIIGAGGGVKGDLTLDALKALEEADMVFGSRRLLSLAGRDAEVFPFYTAREIADILFKEAVKPGRILIRAAALYSGDIGFFSGAGNVAQEIKKLAEEKGFEIETELFPGISSMSLLSALSGISYDGAELISHHGRKGNPVLSIISHQKTFLLPSDADDLKGICCALSGAGYGDIRVCAGFDLSGEGECLVKTTAEEFTRRQESGLCCAFFLNDPLRLRPLTPGIPDGFFERGKAPMTKEEIREIILCKLRLRPEAVFFDVGSGTGSVAVEAALLSDSVRVYAIEKDEEACALIRRNAEKAGAENVEVIFGSAAEALETLPPPTHLFIGGSGGQLKEILRKVALMKKGPVRVVLSAVTLETLAGISELLPGLSYENEEFVSININRSRKAGKYHLMQAENMIYVISFDLP